LIDNPFLPYLVNERKVKLKYFQDNEWKWFDFVIKTVSENSETYKFTYTAEDLFINELSKTGTSLTFDEKLGNNQGTVQELAERILEGTDWIVGENTETIKQTKEEPLYEIILNRDITAFRESDGEESIIPSGEKIYAFYSCVINNTKDYFQFLYAKNGQYLVNKDDIIDADNGYHATLNVDVDALGVAEYTSKYRGFRYIRAAKRVYSDLLKRYVDVYQDDNGATIHGYMDYKYLSPTTVENFITNSKDFTNYSGWKDANNTILSVDSELVDGQTYGILTQKNNNYLLNSGLRDNYTKIDRIVAGDKFILAIKIEPIDKNASADFTIGASTFKVKDTGHEKLGQDIMRFDTQGISQN
jgi:hypothetical protein